MLAFLTLGFVACDVIEEPYKKDNTGGNTGGGDEITKNVLLEDFTGVRCNNCPAAGELAINLQNQYGHNLIVLGVHAGFLANPMGTYPDFMTEEGTEWYTNFGFTSNPIGTVNRKLNAGTYGFDSPSWGEAVASAMQEEAQVEMTAEIEYNSRNLNVKISSEFLAEMPNTYNLTVLIMEDSIVGKQLTPNGNVDDYVHRHVFRECINATWGEEINNTSIAPGDVIEKSYTTTLNEAYNEDQCYVIAYISDSNTKEVLQVIEEKIK